MESETLRLLDSWNLTRLQTLFDDAGLPDKAFDVSAVEVEAVTQDKLAITYFRTVTFNPESACKGNLT